MTQAAVGLTVRSRPGKLSVTEPRLFAPGREARAVLFARKVLRFPEVWSLEIDPVRATATVRSSSTGSSGYSSGSLSDIPGVPSSLASCVAYRESTDLQNPAADGNAYGIIPASGYNVSGTSIAHQKQVFAQLYAQDGATPWAADGCPGT